MPTIHYENDINATCAAPSFRSIFMAQSHDEDGRNARHCPKNEQDNSLVHDFFVKKIFFIETNKYFYYETN
jgi:hypothetical protein